MRQVATLLVSVWIAPVSAQQPAAPLAGVPFESIVAPAGYANTEGNGSNYWPWNQYPTASYLHVQEIYDSANFTNQGVTGPIRITQLRYRANGGPGAWGGGMWPNVRIDVSTAAVDYLAPSLTFAQNHGPDRATVLAGQVIVQAGSGSTPGPWYVTIPVTPFVYDPGSGDDFVIDIEIVGMLVGTSLHVDHVSGAASPPPLGTRLLTASSGSPVGTSISFHYTPVTEFRFERLAAYETLGPGCVGSGGVPSNRATSLPLLGQTMVVRLGNLPPPAVAAFAVGWNNTTSSLGMLPYDLGALGAPGCTWRVSLDLPVLLAGAGGASSFSFAIPNDRAYLGLRFYTQALVLDAAANALGATASDAAVAQVGF